MFKAIINYHQDEFLDWVAELECGHFQHIRHNPPWINRPWVLTSKGRSAKINNLLNCKKCDEGAPRDKA